MTGKKLIHDDPKVPDVGPRAFEIVLAHDHFRGNVAPPAKDGTWTGVEDHKIQDVGMARFVNQDVVEVQVKVKKPSHMTRMQSSRDFSKHGDIPQQRDTPGGMKTSQIAGLDVLLNSESSAILIAWGIGWFKDNF